MAVGVLYWALWRIVPRWFGYDFVPRKEKLSDGTVVTVVRLAFPIYPGIASELTIGFAVLDEKARLDGRFQPYFYVATCPRDDRSDPHYPHTT